MSWTRCSSVLRQLGDKVWFSLLESFPKVDTFWTTKPRGIHSLKLTARPWKWGTPGKGDSELGNHHFQVRAVSFREGNVLSEWYTKLLSVFLLGWEISCDFIGCEFNIKSWVYRATWRNLVPINKGSVKQPWMCGRIMVPSSFKRWYAQVHHVQVC